MLNNNILALTSKICINASIKLFIIFNIFAKVKFFTVIFSVYILVLSLSPCIDDDDCIKHNNNKTEQTHNKQDNKTENCSPFCICSCCAHIISVFSEKTEVCKLNLVLFTKILINRNETFISEPYFSIWHPPQIS